MRVLIAGGGTGGHIYIGIAVARELKRRVEWIEFLFVGTERGLESRIVPQHGFRLEFIDSAGLKGMSLGSLVRNLLIVPKSLMQSRAIARRYSPDVVVGLGAYSSGPVVATAWWLGMPTLIIEPNAQPGLANRWLARIVNRAAVANPEASRYFGAKGVVTGIPVRPEFGSVARKAHRRGELTLLIYGGSRGSRALNQAVCASLPFLRKFGPRLRIIHQTGEQHLDSVQTAYRAAAVQADVRAFLPRIYEEFALADLLLCRAGAGTVAELTMTGKASILVPFPGAADDHQTKNAKALERAGAARMIPERDLTAERLAAEIEFFLDHPEAIDRMEEAARRQARPDAAERIADLIIELAKN